MAYSSELAEKVRRHLSQFPDLDITEKKMFSGISFLVNEKMCIGVAASNLMVRFDPLQQSQIELRPGYLPMIMRGKHLKGYAYVAEEGYVNPGDLSDWVKLCLDYNPLARSSKKRNKKKSE